MMKCWVILVIGIGVVSAVQSPQDTCSCRSDTVDIDMALKSAEDGLCSFGCIFLDCMNRCQLPGAENLQQAINAKCTGSGIIVSILCLFLPVLQTFL